MNERIKNKELRMRVVEPQEAFKSIKNGMTVAMGGYTPSGYPKLFAKELVKRQMEGEDIQINLISGANIGPEIDDMLARAGIIKRRTPMHESKELSKLINQGKVRYAEQQMSKMPGLIHYGVYGKIDVAVVEAIGITEEGYIIPSASVGMVPYFVQEAEAVIVELNMAQPAALNGMHDIYMPGFYPDRKPIPLTNVKQRIGDPFIRLDCRKIKHIVISDVLDSPVKLESPNVTATVIADNLLNFLELETKKRLGNRLPPIQSGFGNIAQSVILALGKSNFYDIEFFCGCLQEANIDLLVSGKASGATAGAVMLTPKVLDYFKNHAEEIRERIVLRNTDITNNAEVIGRMGIIALTSAIEVDMYGNVNSSHIMGTRVLNGIGGGATFAQNAYLSILLLPSTTKKGAISTIVPMASHIDIIEHDVDVIITENGIADLRGKDDRERAACIIENCTSLLYKEQLKAYFEKSITETGGHHPQLLEEAYSWHLKLKETGTMLTE